MTIVTSTAEDREHDVTNPTNAVLKQDAFDAADQVAVATAGDRQHEDTIPMKALLITDASHTTDQVAVKAEDNTTTAEESNFFHKLWDKWNPVQWMTQITQAASCDYNFSNDADLENFVDGFLNDLHHPGKARTDALHKLFLLADREHPKNRVPIVHSTRFDVIASLALCIAPNVPTNDRRQALAIFNNLCIPVDNKAVILFRESHKDVLPVLLSVVRSCPEESHLAIVCLFNLAFLDEAKPFLFYYVAPDDGTGAAEQPSGTALRNQLSLLRTMEAAVSDAVPVVMAQLSKSESMSKEASFSSQEVVRWAMRLLDSLVTCKEDAIAVASDTIFPHVAIQCLASTSLDEDENKKMICWNPHSLEDNALLLLLHLAQHGDECILALQSEEMTTMLRRLEGIGGVHGGHVATLTRLLQTT